MTGPRSRSALLIRSAKPGPAMLMEPFAPDPAFAALRALVDGARPYVLTPRWQGKDHRDDGRECILYGYAKGVDGDEPERPLARIRYEEACRFLKDRAPAISVEPL